MRLSELYRNQFDAGVRSRGAAYFHRGAVRIEFGDAVELNAVVTGSRPYHTAFYLEEDCLVGYCDCPYYETEGRCKHLWALLLAADDRGFARIILVA